MYQTPLLGPELVGLLEQGSIFQRFYPGRFDPAWDIADSVAGGSSWQRAFATADAETVEALCRKVNSKDTTFTMTFLSETTVTTEWSLLHLGIQQLWQPPRPGDQDQAPLDGGRQAGAPDPPPGPPGLPGHHTPLP